MPVTDAYATAATYRSLVDKSTTTEDGEINDDLLAISRYIDLELGRFFTKDAAPVARDFWPRVESLELMVDDMAAAPTVVASDDTDDGTPETTWTVTTDYVVHPANAALGPEAKPYTKILIPSYSSKRFYAGRLVRVTAVWGWPAVPKAIERATCHLTAILRLETSRAESTVSELGAVLSASPQARSIIDKLKDAYSRRAYAV